MDMYGLQTPDFFRIDDLLDFSNDELFSSSTVHHHLSTTPEIPAGNHSYATSINSGVTNLDRSTNFPDGLCVPSDDVAELEWLSNFVDDSMSDFPTSNLTGNIGLRPENSVPGRARSKRSRAVATHNTWISMPESDIPMTGKKSVIAGEQSSSSSGARKCTHCASEKTPQWRTGPMGPKTLCNACGVRYKSGRLVPEYRPAASPTFVLTEHSNSHRKVMELRRQKENLREENNNNHHQLYHQHPQSDFQVC